MDWNEIGSISGDVMIASLKAFDLSAVACKGALKESNCQPVF
jgi:hypothetical protein